MKRLLFLTITVLTLMVSGCNYSGTPVEWANTCDKANDDKYVEVVGFFYNSGSAMCSKSGKEPMRCPIDFIDAIGSTKPPIRAYLDKGSGTSSIDAEKDKPLQIKDDKSEIIDNKQKVKVVAHVKRLDNGGVDGCYVNIKKIEKAQ